MTAGKRSALVASYRAVQRRIRDACSDGYDYCGLDFVLEEALDALRAYDEAHPKQGRFWRHWLGRRALPLLDGGMVRCTSSDRGTAVTVSLQKGNVPMYSGNDGTLQRLAVYCPPRGTVYFTRVGSFSRSFLKVRAFVVRGGQIEEVTRMFLARTPDGVRTLHGTKETSREGFIRLPRESGRSDARIAADAIGDLLGYSESERLIEEMLLWLASPSHCATPAHARSFSVGSL